MRTTTLSIFIGLILTGCAVFQPHASVPTPAGLPAQFSMFSMTSDHPDPWWLALKDRTLDNLMEEAISENFTIREAWARMKKARAAAGKAGADRVPSLTYTAGKSWSEREGGSQTSSDGWSIGLSANYEVDLWGRVRAKEEEAALSAMASAEDLRAAIMTVSGQIAEIWLDLQANVLQQQLLDRQLALQDEIRDLVQARFPLARSTALDIYQQQQSIETLTAALIPLKSREEISRRQLALLLGKASLESDVITDPAFPALPPLPAVGLPADLLAARPDIRAAGLRLKAAEWEINAARADRLPALRLTASQTYSARDTGLLFENWIRNLAANLSGPVFDGHRRQEEVERAKAVAEEHLAAYGKVVFTAVKEVEDAMAQEKQQEQTMTLLQRRLALSQKTMREATRRYLNGNSNFLNVLKEELNLLQLQQDIITTDKEIRLARIRLYKALGGSWADRFSGS